MIRTITTLTLLLVCSIAVAGIDLARTPDWDIVIAPGDGPRVEHDAATELRDHFALAAGVRLPIVTEIDRPRRHLFVGDSAAMRASHVGFETDGFGPEQLRVVIGDDNIAIAGGAPRGTLYGVYTFLENHLGVRFLTREHTHVPPVGASRVLEPQVHDYDPPFSFRWSYFAEVNRDPAFAARVRCNAVPTEDRLGGRTGRILIEHSFQRQIPIGRFGPAHPEYYCEIDGVRRAGKGTRRQFQPCLTNPEVLDIVTEAVLAKIRKHPERTNVEVSQNDNGDYCRCERCAAIDDREGTAMGSLMTFVNAVADRVAKRHPDVKVGTLAYQYSRKAPATVKPRPNVQIQLCSIECSMIQPLTDPDCAKNVAFCRDFRDWARLCDDIAIWNYNANFRNYLLPCPNLRVIEPNVRLFRDLGAKAVFMQAPGDSLSSELSDLRNYMISSLLWDPDRSGQALMDEFLRLHYRSAAPPIRRFINLVHDNAEQRGITQHCFGNAADYGINARIVEAGLRAFDEAARLADDVEVRRRVEKASICVHRAAMEDAWIWAQRHRDDLETHPIPTDMAARTRPHTRRLFALCARYGVDRWREWLHIEQAAALLRQAYGLKEGEGF